jgi:hypothetical protein
MNTQEQSQAMKEARFRALLEETLFPSTNNIELIRTPNTDYSYRFGSKQPHIAELFQENTKLHPFSPLTTSINVDDYDEARKWFFTTPYRMKESDVKSSQKDVVMWGHQKLSASLQNIFLPFADNPDKYGLLYSVDLFLLHGDKLLKQVPNANYFWVEKRLKSPELQLLRSSIVNLSKKVATNVENLLFLVGVPWRYMMFFGPRGYRKMMFDAGQLMHYVDEKARESGWNPICCQEFYDTRINKVLLMDGTERSTLAVTLLTEGGDRDEQSKS